MAKDNEKKDLDQLINSMFRGHRLNTVSAEDYLEQVRQPWFGCACCPSNISRFIPSLPGYVYAVKDNQV